MYNEYDQPKVAVLNPIGAGMLGVRETVKQQLTRQRDEVAQHLANLESVLKFLAENPNFEQFHDVLRRAGF